MKSAVESFAKELYEKFEMKGDGKVFDELLEQANEMFEQQIIEFAENWSKEILRSDRNTNIEQSYNETFKSE